jgi:glycolate oxidase iron-sulfur subunit
VNDAILDPLSTCVHCGFCLPACPTYLATGDEADSPRGRILLMRALARGELSPNDSGLNDHLDACLGCRGCEPVCPSGVQYGAGLEAARDSLVRAHGLPLKARLILRVFRHVWLWKPLLFAARLLRATGLPAALAGRTGIRFAMGMLDASGAGWAGWARWAGVHRPAHLAHPAHPAHLFTGCVMSTLFSHVHEATGKALRDVGHAMDCPRDQACCGALHAHAGDLDGARALARHNIAAFRDSDGPIVVNSAGCGAMLKGYGHLLGSEEAARFAERVKDVSEILADGADSGQRSTVDGQHANVSPDASGAAAGRPCNGLARLSTPRASLSDRPPVRLSVLYDSPCHLQHAQGILAEPLAMLQNVPGLTLLPLADSEKCCGSAGIFSLLEPGMSQAVLDAKLDAILAVDPAPDLVLTGNPGCLMQIGAGLWARGSAIRVAHPVEVVGLRSPVVGCR